MVVSSPGPAVYFPRMPEMPARLTVVTLGARNLPELRRFYRSLGWEEVPGSGEAWAGFLLGGVLLALYPARDLAAEAAQGAPAPAGWSGITLACNVDDPHQVDSAFAAAVRAGAEVVAEPVSVPWTVVTRPGAEAGAICSAGAAEPWERQVRVWEVVGSAVGERITRSGTVEAEAAGAGAVARVSVSRVVPSRVRAGRGANRDMGMPFFGGAEVAERR